MTDAELDMLLDQHPGWVAIERLVAEVRQAWAVAAAQRAEIHELRQLVRQWYDTAQLPQQWGESGGAHRARQLALRNATAAQIRTVGS